MACHSIISNTISLLNEHLHRRVYADEKWILGLKCIRVLEFWPRAKNERIPSHANS